METILTLLAFAGDILFVFFMLWLCAKGHAMVRGMRAQELRAARVRKLASYRRHVQALHVSGVWLP